jgi:hypothetical protein
MLRLTLVLVCILAGLPAASAAELIMVERPGCSWCAAFDREIAPVYVKTPEGRRAPLRRIQLDEPLPQDLSFLTIERWTPLFILVDRESEVGRIRGYPGPEGFWTQFAMLVDRLPQPGGNVDTGRALSKSE